MNNLSHFRPCLFKLLKPYGVQQKRSYYKKVVKLCFAIADVTPSKHYRLVNNVMEGSHEYDHETYSQVQYY